MRMATPEAPPQLGTSPTTRARARPGAEEIEPDEWLDLAER